MTRLFHTPPERTGRLRRPVAMLMALLLGAGAALAATPTAAQAAPTDYRIGFKSGDHTIGTLAPRSGSGGNRVICVNSRYGDPAKLTSCSNKTEPKIAYLMWKYANTSSDVNAAALAKIVKDKYDKSSQWDSMWNGFKNTSNGSKVRAKEKSMESEAAKLAGPYKFDISLERINSTTGTLKNVGIVTGSGAFYDGEDITLTITGPGTFSDGTKSKVVKSASSPKDYPILFTGPQEVKITAKTGKVMPGVKFKWCDNGNAKQPMITPITTKYAVTGSTTADDDGFDADADLSSRVAQTYLRPGTSLRDVVSVRGQDGAAGLPITVRNTLYGPFAEQPDEDEDVPSGAPVVYTGTQTVTIGTDLRASATFDSPAITQLGYYVWVEEVVGDDNFDAKVNSFGRTSEMTLVLDPRVATQVSNQLVRPGDSITDTVTVTGIKVVEDAIHDIEFSMDGAVLGPLQPRTENGRLTCNGLDWSTAPEAMETEQVEVTEDGEIEGYGEFTPDAPGCYTYTETIRWVSNGQGGSYTHEPGNPAQTLLAQGEIAIWSQANAVVMKAGDRPSDRVFIEGLAPDMEAEVESFLYGPFDALPETPLEHAPNNAPFIGSATGVAVGTSEGVPGSVVHVDVTLDQPLTQTGLYVWVESASVESDLIVNSPQFGKFGVVAESAFVTDPKIATQVSDQNPSVGPISDTVTITGLNGLRDFARSRGAAFNATVSGGLYGPMNPVDGTCDAVDWSEAPKHTDIRNVAVDGDGDITGIGETWVTPGCWSYAETLTVVVDFPAPPQEEDKEEVVDPDPITITVDHPVGHVSQTALVSEPTIATQISNQNPEVGPIHDTVTITGLSRLTENSPIEAFVTGGLYGPVAPVDGACTAVDWTDAPLYKAIDPVQVTGDGDISGIGEAWVTPGCWSYGEKLTLRMPGPGETPVEWSVDHPVGHVTQTGLVKHPTMVTQTSDFVANPGDEITDTVWVAGIGAEPGEMEYTLWGPYEIDPALGCDAITKDDWAAAVEAGTVGVIGQGVMQITGNGEYITPPVATLPDVTGCYTWAEKMTVPNPEKPDEPVVVETPPGEENEVTLTVKPVIATVIDADSKYAGAEVTDDVTVTSTHGRAGTAIGTLLGPVAPLSGNTCPVEGAAEWNGADEVDSVEIRFEGDTSFTTDPIKTDRREAGCYTWTWMLVLDDEKVDPVLHLPGVPEETTLLVKPPRIDTGEIGGINIGLIAGSVVLLAGAAGLIIVGVRRRQTAG